MEALRMTATSIRRGRRPELWEEAARQERRLLAEIEQARRESGEEPQGDDNHGTGTDG